MEEVEVGVEVGHGAEEGVEAEIVEKEGEVGVVVQEEEAEA